MEENKIKYEEPRMEITKFDAEDIITTSMNSRAAFLGEDETF